MALFASTSALQKVQKFSKNVQLATALLKVAVIKLGQHYGEYWKTAGSIPDYKYSKAMAAHGKNLVI